MARVCELVLRTWVRRTRADGPGEIDRAESDDGEVGVAFDADGALVAMEGLRHRVRVGVKDVGVDPLIADRQPIAELDFVSAIPGELQRIPPARPRGQRRLVVLRRGREIDGRIAVADL